ncbi:MAG: SCP2 sterol-binding domain-containing protein [Clostridia bacterium]|nr:SCP2 sterol-binding domain-containing protein [Clostridia bacterium]
MHFNTLDELLCALPALAQQHQAALAGRSALFLLKTRQGREACISLQSGAVTVTDTCPQAPDCTVTANEGDLLDMIGGKLNPAKALMLGKVKIQGNPKPLLDLVALLK